MFVSCECCGLSARGLCVGLVTRPESDQVCVCVCVCASGRACMGVGVGVRDRDDSTTRRFWPTRDCGAMKRK